MVYELLRQQVTAEWTKMEVVSQPLDAEKANMMSDGKTSVELSGAEGTRAEVKPLIDRAASGEQGSSGRSVMHFATPWLLCQPVCTRQDGLHHQPPPSHTHILALLHKRMTGAPGGSLNTRPSLE